MLSFVRVAGIIMSTAVEHEDTPLCVGVFTGHKRTSDPLELVLQVVASYTMWVLELGF